MGCLTTSEVAEIQVKIDRIGAQLVLAYDAFDRALENLSVEEYRFDSGDGSQKTINRDPMMAEKTIRGLESRMDWYIDHIRGKGISSFVLRRDKAGRTRYLPR